MKNTSPTLRSRFVRCSTVERSSAERTRLCASCCEPHLVATAQSAACDKRPSREDQACVEIPVAAVHLRTRPGSRRIIESHSPRQLLQSAHAPVVRRHWPSNASNARSRAARTPAMRPVGWTTTGSHRQRSNDWRVGREFGTSQRSPPRAQRSTLRRAPSFRQRRRGAAYAQ